MNLAQQVILKVELIDYQFLSAIKSTQERLKLYNKMPLNGW